MKNPPQYRIYVYCPVTNEVLKSFPLLDQAFSYMKTRPGTYIKYSDSWARSVIQAKSKAIIEHTKDKAGEDMIKRFKRKNA